MADNDRAQHWFRRALAGGKLPDAALRELRPIANRDQPLNMISVACAALYHGGAEQEALDILLPQIAAASNEEGAPHYCTWSACAISTLPAPACLDYWTSWLAVSWLAYCQSVTHLRLNDSPWETSRRPGEPASAFIGNRAIGRPGEVKDHVELNPGAFFAARARGIQIARPRHPRVYDWAIDAALQRGHRVSLPDTRRECAALVIPVSSGQRFDIMRGPAGEVFCRMARSTHNTRGPAMGVYYDGKSQLTVLSPAEPTGHAGIWTHCDSFLTHEDGNWFFEAWQRDDKQKKIKYVVPFDPVEHYVRDASGCRLFSTGAPAWSTPVGPPPGGPATRPLPADAERGLAMLNEAIGPDLPHANEARGALHVARSVLVQDFETARAAARNVYEALK